MDLKETEVGLWQEAIHRLGIEEGCDEAGGQSGSAEQSSELPLLI